MFNIAVLPTGRKLISNLFPAIVLSRLTDVQYNVGRKIEGRLKRLVSKGGTTWSTYLSRHQSSDPGYVVYLPSDIDYSLFILWVGESGTKRTSERFDTPNRLLQSYQRGRICVISKLDLWSGDYHVVKNKSDLVKLIEADVPLTDVLNFSQCCRFDLRPKMIGISKDNLWLVELQSPFSNTYGVSRSFEVGCAIDFFGVMTTTGCVLSVAGTVLVTDVISLPTTLLELPDYMLVNHPNLATLQSNLVKLLSSKGMGKITKSVFWLYTIHIRSQNFLDQDNAFTRSGMALPTTVSFFGERGLWDGEGGGILGEDLHILLTRGIICWASGEIGGGYLLASTGCWDKSSTFGIGKPQPAVGFTTGTELRFMADLSLRPHVMIIAGQKGIGKTNLSRMFADYDYCVCDSDTYGRIVLHCAVFNCSLPIAMLWWFSLSIDERESQPSACEHYMDSIRMSLVGDNGDRWARSAILQAKISLIFGEWYALQFTAYPPHFFRECFIRAGAGKMDDQGTVIKATSDFVFFVHHSAEMHDSGNSLMVQLRPLTDPFYSMLLRKRLGSTLTQLLLSVYYNRNNPSVFTSVTTGELMFLVRTLVGSR